MSTFQPSMYSYGGDYGFQAVQTANGGTALRARCNSGCSSLKGKGDEYRAKMVKYPIWPFEGNEKRAYYETKSIEADVAYNACLKKQNMAAGSVKDIPDKKKTPAKTTAGKNMPPPPPKTFSPSSADDQAAVDGAAPASGLPGIVLLLGGVVAVGGIGYYIFHRNKKHKKHGKHGKHGEHGEHVSAAVAAPAPVPAPVVAPGVH